MSQTHHVQGTPAEEVHDLIIGTADLLKIIILYIAMWQSHSAVGRARLIRGSTASLSMQLLQVHVYTCTCTLVDRSSEPHASNRKCIRNRESVWFNPDQRQIVYP